MEFKVGVYEDMPFEEYNEIPAYRASDIKDVDKCSVHLEEPKRISRLTSIAGRSCATHSVLGVSQL